MRWKKAPCWPVVAMAGVLGQGLAHVATMAWRCAGVRASWASRMEVTSASPRRGNSAKRSPRTAAICLASRRSRENRVKAPLEVGAGVEAARGEASKARRGGVDRGALGGRGLGGVERAVDAHGDHLLERRPRGPGRVGDAVAAVLTTRPAAPRAIRGNTGAAW